MPGVLGVLLGILALAPAGVGRAWGQTPSGSGVPAALFDAKQWPEYVAASEQALKDTPPDHKTWHAASRLALAAKLAKDERDPAAIADANFADAPTAKAVFLGVTELLDDDTRNVAALAKALHESRASLSQIAGWLSENGFDLGAATMRVIPAFYFTMPPTDRAVWDAVKAYPEIPAEKREPLFAILKRYEDVTRPEQRYALRGLRISVERLYRQDPKWEYLEFVVQCARHLPPARAKLDVSFVDTPLINCNQPEHAARLAAALVELDPTSTEAKAKHAECLRRAGRPNEGLAVRRETEATAPAGERREARLDLLRAMAPEQLEQELAARQQAADADPTDEQAKLALADVRLVQFRRSKDWHTDPQLRREAAQAYASLLETTKNAEVRRDAWSGLAECDPAQAIRAGLPIAEQVLATHDPAAPVAPGHSSDARRFAKEAADALWSALRELNAAPIAEDKAALSAELCRQAAAMFALCSAKSPRLHASVRIRLAAAHALAGDYDKAVQAYAQDLDTNSLFRSEAKRHVKELFDKQSLTPSGGRLDSPVTRRAQWKMGVYLLGHFTTETLSTRRRANGGGRTSNIEQRTSNSEQRTRDGDKVRAEILGIWGGDPGVDVAGDPWDDVHRGGESGAGNGGRGSRHGVRASCHEADAGRGREGVRVAGEAESERGDVQRTVGRWHGHEAGGHGRGAHAGGRLSGDGWNRKGAKGAKGREGIGGKGRTATCQRSAISPQPSAMSHPPFAMSPHPPRLLFALAVLGVLRVSVVPSCASTILVLGLEETKGREISPTTDVMLLVRVDTVATGKHDGRIDILSIPRDTQAFIPGHGIYKLNHAYPLGDIELTRRTIQQVLGVCPTKHVVVDFAGFKRIVGALGGVTVNVRREMKYEDKAGGLKIDLNPGVQRLDPEQCLGFVRWRTSDVARTAQHRQFLVSFWRELIRPANARKVPRVIAQGDV